MKANKILIICAALGFSMGCDEGTSDNPATVTRNELNPPRGLQTVTGDKQIELRWQTGNAEDGFRGYNVFAYEGALDSLPAPKFPQGETLNLATDNIPRCLDNSAIFVAFGFPESDLECEVDQTDGEAADAPAMNLQEDGEEPLAELGAIVNCGAGSTAEGNENISMLIGDGTVDSLTEQVCVVTALADGTALKNGTTYTFFVAAVMGDEFKKLSWTSNFVEDTPAIAVFSGDVTIAVGKQLFIDAAKIGAAGGAAVSMTGSESYNLLDIGVITKDDFVTQNCTQDVCSVIGGNNSATNDDGIYLGRLGGSNPQRVFFSTPADGTVAYQLRGPQTNDPRKDPAEIATSIPGDQATEGVYITDGVKTPVYGNQVFDLRVTNGSDKFYGKVVVKTPTLATPDDGTSLITLNVTILMQSKANEPHYIQ